MMCLFSENQDEVQDSGGGRAHRETGREIWVVMQRKVGCGTVGNILD